MHSLNKAECLAIDAIFAPWDGPCSPGAALVVLRDGQPAYLRSYGLANLEYSVPITPDTVFHVASVSKQFTAAAILLLAADGLLGVDDEVRSHLPYVPDLGHPITLRHLINHASGLRDQWELLRWAGWRMDDVITQEHLLKMARRQEALNFRPGDEYSYSNTGYTLLSEVVAKVSGKPLRDFTQERIFRPLGMHRTFFFSDHEEIVRDRAYSYGGDPKAGFRKSVLSFANTGATSLFTTARDLGCWLLHLAEIEGSAMAEAMQTRLVFNSGETHTYAAGLDIREHRGLKLIGHSGSDAGYRSYCGRFPEHNMGIAILCNLGTMEPAKLTLRVAEVLLGDYMAPVPQPEHQGNPQDANVDLANYTGRYAAAEAGLTVEVTQDADKLLIKVGQLPPVLLTAVGPDRFFHPQVEDVVVFERKGTAPAERLVLPVYGLKLTAKRILPPLPASEAQQYVGDYYSPELDTTYRLRPGQQGLQLTHQRIADTDLLPLAPGEFAVDRPGGGYLVFGSNTGGAAGFSLTGTRCRRVSFAKIG